MRPDLERRLLVAALRGMAVAAAVLGLVLSWRYASGPERADGPPSVRVVKLLPGTFLWADAPSDARVLPPGARTTDAARVKLLVLRGEDTVLRSFWLPAADGRPTLPTGADLLMPGLPCADLAPDFGRGDIACRQPAKGFEFATRHRWSLAGKALTSGTPDLLAAPGQEVDGDWVLQGVGSLR